MRKPVTLIKGDRLSSFTDYRDSLPVNMYAVKRPGEATQGYMLQYPGLSLYATGVGADRGGVYNERFGMLFRVSGQKLISVSSSGLVTELGDIPGTSQARLSDFYSFNTQAIIADGNMFLYNPSTGLSQVTDPNIKSPLDGVWIDGYYLLTDGEYVYNTKINDETAIDPLQYGTAEFMPDPSIGMGKTRDDKAIVFGRYTTQYLSDDATQNFAFTPISTRTIEVGIVATHAKCQIGDDWYITGGRKGEALAVYRITSGIPVKVSTREVDDILSEYGEADLSNMRMESVRRKDTVFIIIHLPNETICFNETVAIAFGKEVAWSMLKTDVQGSNPYRAINGVFDPRSSQWIYGDRINGSIGLLDETVTTHYGDKVEWLLYSPLLFLEAKSLDELEIQTIPGHNTVDDATVAVSLTGDGISYGKEYWMQYGSPLNYSQRFIKRRLGYVRDWVGFKFRGVSESRMTFDLMTVEYN